MVRSIGVKKVEPYFSDVLHAQREYVSFFFYFIDDINIRHALFNKLNKIQKLEKQQKLFISVVSKNMKRLSVNNQFATEYIISGMTEQAGALSEARTFRW